MLLLNNEWIQKLAKDNSYPSRLEGNLLFLKNSSGETKMQKRYLILKGNLLFYFYKKSDKVPLGLIVLEGYTVELSNEFEGYCFQLLKRNNFSNSNQETKNCPSYTFAVENPDLLDAWIGALTTCSYENMKLTVESLKEQATNLLPNEFADELNPVAISAPAVGETKRKSKTFAELHEQYGKQIEDVTKSHSKLSNS